MSNDWIEHNGGPQPVADDVWVVVDKVGFGSGYATAWQPAWLNWNKKIPYRILNQHLIDSARLEGIRLGLEAALAEAVNWVSFQMEERVTRAVRNLNPDTIAKEAQHD